MKSQYNCRNLPERSRAECKTQKPCPAGIFLVTLFHFSQSLINRLLLFIRQISKRSVQQFFECVKLFLEWKFFMIYEIILIQDLLCLLVCKKFLHWGINAVNLSVWSSWHVIKYILSCFHSQLHIFAILYCAENSIL